MLDFSRRARDLELLDLGVPATEMARSLSDLRLVHRRLSNSARLERGIRSLLEGLERPSLLDVGCGSANLLALILDRFGAPAASRLRNRSSRPLLAVGVDLKAAHLRLAPRTVRVVAADARSLPFAPESFDVVVASHFLHHFDDAELPPLLAALHSLARRALVVNDLERSRVAYGFGRVVFPLIFASRVSVYDGLVSIRRGFRAAELTAAFREAGIEARVARCWPYRLMAVAVKDGPRGSAVEGQP